MRGRAKRVGVVLVACENASNVANVVDRIPEGIRRRVEVVLVCDTDSQEPNSEPTHYRHPTWEQHIPVIYLSASLGYGGKQKAAYRWAIDHDLDIVVLIHGDRQYSPESMGDLLRPIDNGDFDVVSGSRMLRIESPRQAGMPLYRYAANRILTYIQNRIVGYSLSDWHSGYRAYRVHTLRSIPFENNGDGFNFDTQIIVQLLESQFRMTEVPISSSYGTEMCNVNRIRWTFQVLTDVAKYRANKMGFGGGPLAFNSAAYELKDGEDSSHTGILSWLTEFASPSSKILDLGCSSGELSARFSKLGHSVTGIDIDRLDGIEHALNRFILADLDVGLPTDVGNNYDIVVAADVLEHIRRPDKLLGDIASCLAPGGLVLASIPNFSHWYPRLRIATGLFDYDRRGILDSSHVRFFTRRSFGRLAEAAGFRVVSCRPFGLPLDALGRRGVEGAESMPRKYRFLVAALDRVNKLSVKLRPPLFAYQYLYELEPSETNEKRLGRVSRQPTPNDPSLK